MHLWTIAIAIIIACIVRAQKVSSAKTWSKRWQENLFLLLFPVLLLLSTAIAILYMGCHGAMLGVQVGSWGCGVAASILLYAVACLIKLIYQSYIASSRLKTYPLQSIESTTARIIDLDLPYTAQIGFWHPELVVSRGLLDTLDREHLSAVFAHEEAHLHYRDTFIFFWLSWIAAISHWLPNTEAVWQELLLLRELRADAKAAQEVDFLLLAESLLAVSQAAIKSEPLWSASFNDYAIGERLNERIDSLLAPTQPLIEKRWQQWSWVSLLFLPLLTIPLHY